MVQTCRILLLFLMAFTGISYVTAQHPANDCSYAFISVPGRFTYGVKNQRVSQEIWLVADTGAIVRHRVPTTKIMQEGGALSQDWGKESARLAELQKKSLLLQTENWSSSFKITSENHLNGSTRDLLLVKFNDDPFDYFSNAHSNLFSVSGYWHESDFIELVADTLLYLSSTNSYEHHSYLYSTKSDSAPCSFRLPSVVIVSPVLGDNSNTLKRSINLGQSEVDFLLNGIDNPATLKHNGNVLTKAYRCSSWGEKGPLAELARLPSSFTRYIGKTAKTNTFIIAVPDDLSLPSHQELMFLTATSEDSIESSILVTLPKNLGGYIRTRQNTLYRNYNAPFEQLSMDSSRNARTLGFTTEVLSFPKEADLTAIMLRIANDGEVDIFDLERTGEKSKIRDSFFDNRFIPLSDSRGNIFELYAPYRFLQAQESSVIVYSPFRKNFTSVGKMDSLSLAERALPLPTQKLPIVSDPEYLRFEILEWDGNGKPVKGYECHSINGIVPKTWSITSDDQLTITASILLNPTIFEDMAADIPFAFWPHKMDGGYSTLIMLGPKCVEIEKNLKELKRVNLKYVGVDSTDNLHTYQITSLKGVVLRNIVATVSVMPDEHTDHSSWYPAPPYTIIIIEGFVCVYNSETGEINFNGINKEQIQPHAISEAIEKTMQSYFKVQYNIEAEVD